MVMVMEVNCVLKTLIVKADIVLILIKRLGSAPMDMNMISVLKTLNVKAEFAMGPSQEAECVHP